MKGGDIINMFSDFYKEIKNAHVIEGMTGVADDQELTSIRVGIAVVLSINEILKNRDLDLKG